MGGKKTFKIRMLRFFICAGLLLGAFLFVGVIDVPFARDINGTLKSALAIDDGETLGEGLLSRIGSAGNGIAGFFGGGTAPGNYGGVEMRQPDGPYADQPAGYRIDEDMLEEINGQFDYYLYQNRD